MAKDAKGHGSEKRSGSDFVQGLQPMTPDQQKTLLGRETPLAAHQAGTDAASKGLFTDAQISVLKEGYAKIKSVDPIQPSYGRMTALLDRASPAQLKQLAGAGIKFVSPLAQNRVSRSGGKSDYTADRIYGDRRDLRD